MVEFDKYKLSPEYKYKNFDITMDQFKFIWYMEYCHRSVHSSLTCTLYTVQYVTLFIRFLKKLKFLFVD